MSNEVEEMEVDEYVDTDDKENEYNNTCVNKTPISMKRYDLDSSEMNMKLRMSCTPMASPISTSFNSNCNKMLFDGGDDGFSSCNSSATLNNTVEMVCVDERGDVTYVAENVPDKNENIDNIKIIVENDKSIAKEEVGEQCKIKEISKPPSSPILRGLKSVLNMFRPSQSPITPTPDETPYDTPECKTPVSDYEDDNSDDTVKNSSHLEVTFNESLVNELQWTEDSTIIFNLEKLKEQNERIGNDSNESFSVVSSGATLDETKSIINSIDELERQLNNSDLQMERKNEAESQEFSSIVSEIEAQISKINSLHNTVLSIESKRIEINNRNSLNKCYNVDAARNSSDGEIKNEFHEESHSETSNDTNIEKLTKSQGTGSHRDDNILAKTNVNGDRSVYESFEDDKETNVVQINKIVSNSVITDQEIYKEKVGHDLKLAEQKDVSIINENEDMPATGNIEYLEIKSCSESIIYDINKSSENIENNLGNGETSMKVIQQSESQENEILNHSSFIECEHIVVADAPFKILNTETSVCSEIQNNQKTNVSVELTETSPNVDMDSIEAKAQTLPISVINTEKGLTNVSIGIKGKERIICVEENVMMHETNCVNNSTEQDPSATKILKSSNGISITADSVESKGEPHIDSLEQTPSKNVVNDVVKTPHNKFSTVLDFNSIEKPSVTEVLEQISPVLFDKMNECQKLEENVSLNEIEIKGQTDAAIVTEDSPLNKTVTAISQTVFSDNVNCTFNLEINHVDTEVNKQAGETTDRESLNNKTELNIDVNNPFISKTKMQISPPIKKDTISKIKQEEKHTLCHSEVEENPIDTKIASQDCDVTQINDTIIISDHTHSDSLNCTSHLEIGLDKSQVFHENHDKTISICEESKLLNETQILQDKPGDSSFCVQHETKMSSDVLESNKHQEISDSVKMNSNATELGEDNFTEAENPFKTRSRLSVSPRRLSGQIENVDDSLEKTITEAFNRTATVFEMSIDEQAAPDYFKDTSPKKDEAFPSSSNKCDVFDNIAGGDGLTMGNDEFHTALDEEFQPGEMFIDSETFDLLMNKNKALEMPNSGKESLFLKFDPLWSKRSLCSPSQTKVVEHSDVTIEDESCNYNSSSEKEEEPLNKTIEKPVLAVSPALNNVCQTPIRSTRVSTNYRSPAIVAIDRLISLSSPLSTRTMPHDDLQEMIEEITLRLAQKEEEVQLLKFENMELRSRINENERIIKKMEEENEIRLNEINEMEGNLKQKNDDNIKMSKVMEEYEKTISSLISEREDEKKNHENERLSLIHERDEHITHLRSMELSFNDLLTKYERCKTTILSFKVNENKLIEQLEERDRNFQKMEDTYESLKQHATMKLNEANVELSKIKKAHDNEVIKLKAIIKRKELEASSLQESLSQKIKDNENLTAICDELISKVDSSN